MIGPRMMPRSSGGRGHWKSFMMMPMPIKTAATGSASHDVQFMTVDSMTMGMNMRPMSG